VIHWKKFWWRKGIAGIDEGIHDFNGQSHKSPDHKIYNTNPDSGYELKQVRNQHTENQLLAYTSNDNLFGNDKYIILK